MTPVNASVPLVGLAAFSGTGKTTLLRCLLPLLTARGLRVGVIKHAHHDFDTDIPGKDSYELRRAGATQMLVASRRRWALVTELAGEREPRLDALLAQLDGDALDLILVEGFKAERFPKIELYRPQLGHPLLCLADRSIVAVATDAPLATEPGVPVLDLNRPEEIAAFILHTLAARHAVRGAGQTPRSTP
jgi:molybdopterin-guanine dinucleotide biosynthesis adapter protein